MVEDLGSGIAVPLVVGGDVVGQLEPAVGVPADFSADVEGFVDGAVEGGLDIGGALGLERDGVAEV